MSREGIFRILGLASGVLITLLGGELIARAFLADAQSLAWKTMVPDRDVYIAWRPNTAETRRSRWGEYHVRINNLGLRMDRDVVSEKSTEVTRIVALGDSFTFGAGIPVGDSFVSIIEDELRYQIDPAIEVLNFGVGSYTMGHNLVRFERDALPLDPDHAFVFYSYNDLEGNRDPTYVNPFRFRFENGRAGLERYPTGTPRQRIVFHSRPYIWFRQRSYLLSALPHLSRSAMKDSTILNPDMVGVGCSSPPDLHKDLLASDELVTRLAQLSEKNHVTLWLIFVPPGRSLVEEIPQFSELSRRNALLAEQWGFPYLDPTAAWRREWRRLGRPEVLLPDHHYNRTGALLYGKVVAEMILRQWTGDALNARSSS
ncbi:MAG TPA: GDSL-type esterase/lipase family protein [Thermoanaerobaculia bacterium]|nr:GDSL-type esterase/lipase family protein [Thermoanaerobaculia bacterium]